MMDSRDDKMTLEDVLLALFMGGVMGILLIAVLVTV